MPPPEEASGSRTNVPGDTRLQEEYKRALVEVIREVMHPPEVIMVSGWFAWCIEVNKLMRDLKSITSKLGAPSNVPQSFLDVHEFLEDAWRIAVAEVVPGFHDKWPSELDSMVEKSLKTGEPLGKMRAKGTRAATRVSASSAAGVGMGSSTGRRRARGEGGTSGSALSVESSPTRFPSALTSPVSPSRLSTAEFVRLVNGADKSSSSPSYSQSESQTPVPASTVSPSPAIHQSISSTPTLTSMNRAYASHPHPILSPSPSPSPMALVAERGASLRRSPSARPWMPPSYRDGSMPAGLVELYERLDEACQCADTLILDAYSLDATDENESEMKLAEWTRSAKRCGASAREALQRLRAAGLSKTGEVLYVASTLNLLRSAHVELVEYAASYLGPSSSAQRSGISGLDSAVSETNDTRTRSVSSISSANRDESIRAEGSAIKSKVIPYVMIPKVPWNWRSSSPRPRLRTTANRTPGASLIICPTSPIPDSDRPYKLDRPADRHPGDAEHDPPCIFCADRGFACFGEPERQKACRRCRRRKMGPCTYAGKPRGGPVNANVEYDPPCSSCADRGLACFGAPGQYKACRRCNHLAKGRCTYAMHPPKQPPAKNKQMKKTLVKARVSVIVKTKGKEKASVDQKVVIGRKRKRPSLETMKKLRSTDARREAWYVAEGQDSSDSDSSSSSSSETGSVPAPKRRRRKSMSPHPTREPEGRARLPMRATSEPPERDRASVAVRAQSRNQSRRPMTFSALARSSREFSPLTPELDSPAGELDGNNGVEFDTTESREPPVQPRLLSTPSASPTPQPEELPSITITSYTPVSFPPAKVTSAVDPNMNNSLLDALSVKLASLTTSQTTLTTELHHMQERHAAETNNIQTKIDAQEGAIAEVRKVMGILRAQMMGATGEKDEGEEDDEDKDDDTMYSTPP